MTLVSDFRSRKRRGSPAEDDLTDECAAALVLMKLSCSPRSPVFSEGSLLGAASGQGPRLLRGGQGPRGQPKRRRLSRKGEFRGTKGIPFCRCRRGRSTAPSLERSPDASRRETRTVLATISFLFFLNGFSKGNHSSVFGLCLHQSGAQRRFKLANPTSSYLTFPSDLTWVFEAKLQLSTDVPNEASILFLIDKPNPSHVH